MRLPCIRLSITECTRLCSWKYSHIIIANTTVAIQSLTMKEEDVKLKELCVLYGSFMLIIGDKSLQFIFHISYYFSPFACSEMVHSI